MLREGGVHGDVLQELHGIFSTARAREAGDQVEVGQPATMGLAPINMVILSCNCAFQYVINTYTFV